MWFWWWRWRRQHFFLEQVDGAGVVIAMHGEAEVGLAVLAQVLDDHVDFDVGVGHSAQDLVRNAWLVGHAQHGDFGFVAVENRWNRKLWVLLRHQFRGNNLLGQGRLRNR